MPRVQTELSVSYVDHNTLQTDFKNQDDHRFLQSIAKKYGIYFSRPGNGICHQVHLERFARPGKTLLGSDSHTPTAGGLGSLAIGAGGLDVALAMAGEPFYLTTPANLQIRLSGEMSPWVSAKDLILEILRRLSVKGGVGKILEYGGPGVKNLTVPERATITNMGAELGATTSIFPSDERTREFLRDQEREQDWVKIEADAGASYDQVIEIDLSQLEPMIARPHSPDNVCPISEVAGLVVNQVIIGSCTNSSYRDVALVARMLKGKTVHPEVSLAIAPGSRQVLLRLAQSGALADLIGAGARILESACGPCIGLGQAPASGAVSLRTFNRNFEGRSGTRDAQVYLCSPEVAVASALAGQITDPRSLGLKPEIKALSDFTIVDNLIIAPTGQTSTEEIIRGPNIKPLPEMAALPGKLSAQVLLKVGDNITTDQIMPAGARVLPLRSNIPALAEFAFEPVDSEFPTRAKNLGGGFILGGRNYGQGSSREHAALVPRYLGIRAVIAISFARIHLANLVNFGILPLILRNEKDYERIDQGDNFIIDLNDLGSELSLVNQTKDDLVIPVTTPLTEREIEIIKAGGKLAWVKKSKSIK